MFPDWTTFIQVKLFLFYILFGFPIALLSAQEVSSSYVETPQSIRTFDKASWEEARAGIDYTEDLQRQPPEAPKERQQDTDFFWDTSWFAEGAFAILIGLTLLAIGLFIYFRWKNKNPNNRRLINGKEVATLETIETELDKNDPTSAIDRAIQLGDFRLALRLYYLKAIRELSLAEHIRWKRDKTNGEYVRELSGNSLQDKFKALTILFERIWYGHQAIGAADFQQIQPQFDQFLAQIQPNEED